MESLGTLGTNQLLEPRELLKVVEVATSGAPRTAQDQVWTKFQPLPVHLWLQGALGGRPKDQSSREGHGRPAGNRVAVGTVAQVRTGDSEEQTGVGQREAAAPGRPRGSHTQACTPGRGRPTPAPLSCHRHGSPGPCSLPSSTCCGCKFRETSCLVPRIPRGGRVEERAGWPSYLSLSLSLLVCTGLGSGAKKVGVQQEDAEPPGQPGNQDVSSCPSDPEEA